MKCPVCQAKLLPVAGELFCLQCGEAVPLSAQTEDEKLTLEETTDPLLQRAISDANDGATTFKSPTPEPKLEHKPAEAPAHQAVTPAAVVQQARASQKPESKPSHTFMPMRAILAAPHPVLAAAGGGSMTPATASPATAPLPAKVPDKVQADSGTVGVVKTAPLAEPLEATTAPGEAPVELLGAARASSGRVRSGIRGTKYWALAVAALAVLVTVNVEAGNYYADRVLPGVKVGQVAVGGMTYDELAKRLPSVAPAPGLSAVVNGRTYGLTLGAAAGAMDYASLQRQIEQTGRNQTVPAIGLVTSWFAPAVQPNYKLTDSAVDHTVSQLAIEINRTPSNAAAMVVGTNVFVLADKPGAVVDAAKATAAIRAAYGHAGTVAITPTVLKASIQTGDYANDVASAQAIISQSITLTIKKAHYSPTASQIAGWITFRGAGKGVTVDPGGVAAYVASLPGTFDRAGAVSRLTAGLNGGVAATLAISTHATVAPTVAPTVVGPAATYTYCVTPSSQQQPALTSALATTLGSGGWTLGGRIRYVAAATGCNVKFAIGSTSDLSALDFACTKQTTCRIHNDVAIAEASWAKAPQAWVGDVASYRGELINQVMGQWLGFDHPSCSVAASQAAVLTTPSVTVAGCSPTWYPVPPEVQDTKVLAGF